MAPTSDTSAIRITKTGITLRVRLTPKASCEQIGTITDTADGRAVQAHVRAPPADGAANRALIVLIANWLGIPKSTVRLVAGSRSRIKTLHVAGDGVGLRTDITKKLSQ